VQREAGLSPLRLKLPEIAILAGKNLMYLRLLLPLHEGYDISQPANSQYNPAISWAGTSWLGCHESLFILSSTWYAFLAACPR